MIYSLNGELIHKEAGLAVVECGGVGYSCRTTYNTLARLGDTGSGVRLFTYLHVTQDGIMLFGFGDRQELECFKLLLGVSGVGPKAALSILSDIDPNSFALAVASGDHKRLTKSKGVGPKMAQRIVLELKDKLSKERSIIRTSDLPAYSPVPSGGAVSEAVDALMVLGYTRDEAEGAVSGLDSSLTAEELIRKALMGLAKFK